jgi:hypothetical protein
VIATAPMRELLVDVALDVDQALDEARAIGLEVAIESTLEGTGYHHGYRQVPLVLERARPATERAPMLLELAAWVARCAGAGEVCRAWVGSLAAGGWIAAHTDTMPAEPRRRFHLPLVTCAGAEFTVAGAHWFHARAGVILEIDPRLEHQARNAGPAARVHLIVDAARGDE